MTIAMQVIKHALIISLVILAGMIVTVSCSIAMFEIMAQRQCVDTNNRTCYINLTK